MKRLISLGLLMIILQSAGFGQNSVTGKVTDSKDGSPLAGVTVQVKGGTETTQTNSTGNFSISVSGKDKILVFSFVGYGTEEINLGNKKEITIALSTEEKKLQEVVVVAYG